MSLLKNCRIVFGSVFLAAAALAFTVASARVALAQSEASVQCSNGGGGNTTCSGNTTCTSGEAQSQCDTESECACETTARGCKCG
jgi:hypothetical protein